MTQTKAIQESTKIGKQNPNTQVHAATHLIVTEVKRCVDGLKRFEVNVNFLLLPFLCHDCAAVDDQTIGRNCKIKFF